MNQKRVLVVCHSCASHNGGVWKNEDAIAPALVGKCGVCGEVKNIVAIHYYKHINADMKFSVPTQNKVEDKDKVVLNGKGNKSASGLTQ